MGGWVGEGGGYFQQQIHQCQAPVQVARGVAYVVSHPPHGVPQYRQGPCGLKETSKQQQESNGIIIILAAVRRFTYSYLIPH